MMKENFGKNLKALRASENETQELLANKLNVDKSTISHWENGRRMPDIEMQESIAKHFNVAVEDLFKGASDVSGEENTNEEAAEFFIYKGAEYCILPRIDIEKTKAYVLFKEAMRIDRKIDTGKYTGDELIEMAHKYWEAFDYGVSEAGVNLLKYLFVTVMGAKNAGKEEHGLDNRINNLIEGLQLYGNPAGDYYEALWLMESLNNNGEDKAKNFEEGLDRLYELASEGNEYALQFVESIEYDEEQEDMIDIL